MKIISVKNLSLAYGDNFVIRDADFDIEQGDFVYIIGGNGSGKSTLVKSILGIVEPTSGELKLFGDRFDPAVVADKFAYVPQHIDIERQFPISVEEVIKLECELQKDQCKISPAEHLKEFSAEKLLPKKLSELSGGELQKVLIARALISHPSVLILDEPTNNLDVDSVKVLRKILEDLNKEHKVTIIMITHDHSAVHARELDKNMESTILSISDGLVKELDHDGVEAHKH